MSCGAVDCDKPVRSKGLCQGHYSKLFKLMARLTEKEFSRQIRLRAWHERHWEKQMNEGRFGCEGSE